jgi:sodium-coupled neutral amino acid transporter 10
VGATSGLVSVWGANSVGITAGATATDGKLFLAAGSTLSAYGGNSLLLAAGDSVAGFVSVYAPMLLHARSDANLVLAAPVITSVHGGTSLALQTDGNVWLAQRGATTPFAPTAVVSISGTAQLDMLASGAGTLSATPLTLASAGTLTAQATGLLALEGSAGARVYGAGAAGVSLYSATGLYATAASAAAPLSLYAAGDAATVAAGNAVTSAGASASLVGAANAVILAGAGTDPAAMTRVDVAIGSFSVLASTRAELTAFTTGTGATASGATFTAAPGIRGSGGGKSMQLVSSVDDLAVPTLTSNIPLKVTPATSPPLCVQFALGACAPA